MDLPEAGFSTENTVGVGPRTVTFTGTTDTNPATDSWQWYFEGGSPEVSTDATVDVLYEQVGSFDVTLIVSNGVGYDTLVVPDMVQITAIPPVADFSASTTVGDMPLEVQFTDASTNAPTSWSWEFPGGTPATSTAQNPLVVYEEPGLYSVTLTVTNAAGSDVKTRTSYILVERPELIADFTSTDPSGSISHSVQFTDASAGLPVAWEWTFEGGTPATSTAQNPSVTYDQIGDYDVKLVVTNEIGDKDSITRVNYVNALPQPPVPDFTVSATAGSAPFVVNFTDNSTNDPTSWLWEFPGGVPSTSSEQNPTVTYSLAGTYSVTLTATNEGGSTTVTADELIDVTVIPPVTDFSVSDAEGIAPFTVTFSDQSANAPTSWQWSFPGGEPSTSTVKNPTVTYAQAGTYSVTLLTSNSAGNDALTREGYITVSYITPVAAFTADVTDGPSPLTVTFTDQSQFAPQSWSWDFPGATTETSTSQNPVVTYETPGTYAVTLRASNDAGENSLTKTDYITVGQPLPEVEFSADIVVGEGPLTVVFDNQTTGAESYQWTFAGGTPRSSSAEHPTVVYESVGAWDVTLLATNSDGRTATLNKSDYITITAITDIPELEVGELWIYPNPSAGAFTVRLPAKPEGGVTLALYNLMGQKLRETQVQSVADREIAWVLSEVPAGLYLLDVMGTDGRIGQAKVWLSE